VTIKNRDETAVETDRNRQRRRCALSDEKQTVIEREREGERERERGQPARYNQFSFVILIQLILCFYY
jgi:hypothetical protein